MKIKIKEKNKYRCLKAVMMLQTIGWKMACMSNDIPVDNKVGGWKLKHKCQKVEDHFHFLITA